VIFCKVSSRIKSLSEKRNASNIWSIALFAGLLDNVLSDYLWAKAILLTTTTVATAGLTIQVPIAAIVDTLTGHAPHLLNYIGAAAVLVGFAGINIPTETQSDQQEQEAPIVSMVDDPLHLPSSRNASDAVS
jgi:solute carrier family 35, member F5